MTLDTAVSEVLTAMRRFTEIQERITLLESEIEAKRSEIAALEVERQQIAENIAPLKDLLPGHRAAPVQVTEPDAGTDINGLPANGVAGNHTVPPMPQTVFETLAKQIITRNGSPMSASTLRDAFHTEGHPIPGVNPRENFNTKVTRARGRGVLRDTSAGLWPRGLRKPKGAHWFFAP